MNDYFSYWERLSLRRLRSWMHDIYDEFVYVRTSLYWQVLEVTTGTAMLEDGERPTGKPPPPSGGDNLPFTCWWKYID